MKILLLSPYSDKLVPALDASGDSYIVEQAPITKEYCAQENIDYVVSYGYRHMLRCDVLDHLRGKVVNLHISMLPWCRGAHPVFWSVVEDRPLGVTIHLIDQGLDTGNILIQQPLEINLNAETFRSTYRHLSDAIENLFINNWAHLRVWQDAGVQQRGGGSMHRASELEQWLEFMPKSWDTPISEFLVLAADRINAYHEPS